MKITLITHHFPPKYTGGIELIAYRTSRWLREQGHSVDVITVENPHAVDREIRVKSEIYHDLHVHRIEADLFSPKIPYEWTYRNPIMGEWFRSYLKKAAPDIIHVHSCYLLSASILEEAIDAKIPTVVSLHDYWFFCPRIQFLRPNGIICMSVQEPATCTWCLMTQRRRFRYMDTFTKSGASWLARRLIKSFPGSNTKANSLFKDLQYRQSYLHNCLKTVDLLLTQSKFLRSIATDIGISSSKIKLLPYGLAMNGWELVGREKSRSDKLRIGFLGQIIHQKGLHVLLKAIKLLGSYQTDLQVMVYGGVEGNCGYRQSVLNKSRHIAPISIEGRYSQEDLGRIFNSLDLVIVPSLWCEIGPLVLMEAFATQTPVIASDLPNMNYLVDDGVNGLVFRHGDSQELANMIMKVLEDRELLKELSNNITPVKSFDDEMSILLDHYRDAAKSVV